VAVLDPTKRTAEPVRRWHGAGQGELPPGRASSLVAIGSKVCWAAGGGAVAMASPGNDKPEWVFPLPADAGEVVGITPLPNGVLVTGSSGVVLELTEAGEVKAQSSLPSGGPRAVAAGVRAGERDVILPSSDGTVNRLVMQKR